MIPSGAKVVMGLGAAQSPALLDALAARARAGEVGDIGLYFMLPGAIARASVMDDALSDRITPYSFFHSGVERELNKLRAAAGRGVVDFIPCHFSDIPGVMCDQVGVDTLVTTVSPMDDRITSYNVCYTKLLRVA